MSIPATSTVRDGCILSRKRLLKTFRQLFTMMDEEGHEHEEPCLADDESKQFATVSSRVACLGILWLVVASLPTIHLNSRCEIRRLSRLTFFQFKYINRHRQGNIQKGPQSFIVNQCKSMQIRGIGMLLYPQPAEFFGGLAAWGKLPNCESSWTDCGELWRVATNMASWPLK